MLFRIYSIGLTRNAPITSSRGSDIFVYVLYNIVVATLLPTAFIAVPLQVAETMVYRRKAGRVPGRGRSGDALTEAEAVGPGIDWRWTSRLCGKQEEHSHVFPAE